MTRVQGEGKCILLPIETDFFGHVNRPQESFLVQGPHGQTLNDVHKYHSFHVRHTIKQHLELNRISQLLFLGTKPLLFLHLGRSSRGDEPLPRVLNTLGEIVRVLVEVLHGRNEGRLERAGLEEEEVHNKGPH